MISLQRQSIIIIDDDVEHIASTDDSTSSSSCLYERSPEPTPTSPSSSLIPSKESEQIFNLESSASDLTEKNGTRLVNRGSSSPTLIRTTTELISTGSILSNKISPVQRSQPSKPSTYFSPTFGSKAGRSRHLTLLGKERDERPGSSACASLDSTPLNESVSRHDPNLFPKWERIATANEQIPELNEPDEVITLWDDEESLQFLDMKDVPRTNGIKRSRQSSTKVVSSQRNLPILKPLIRLESFQYMKFNLRAKKIVELCDGDFLHITDIICNSMTGQVTLRGLRYQRTKALNGMLERKLNEVCLFYEIDLDDVRQPNKQSAIEISVDKVKTVRNIRRTNQSFPLCRNLEADQFSSPAEAADEGGLTARWKYICRYHSAEDRWNNNWAERSLEQFREEECTSGCGVSDADKRLQWRGETVKGGSHRPVVATERFSCPERTENPIRIASENSEPDIVYTAGHQNKCNHSREPQSRNSRRLSATATTISKKGPRTLEPPSLQNLIEVTRVLKKARLENRTDVGAARTSMGRLQINETGSRDVHNVKHLDSEPSRNDTAKSSSKNSKSVLPLTHRRILSANRLRSATTKTSIVPTINAWSSGLTTPPSTGVIIFGNQSTRDGVIKPAGQMLTFGDAFCGAGGTTRGAVMAGLKVKWGFDFWEHACATWKANFSDAACYNMASEEFVSMGKLPNGASLPGVKVDILHLSPPCQYFSPAHTVNGIDDEKNIASLFAVLGVVELAKPRVVTLEQTFGILGARYRLYFAALIHMFAVLRFSVRWAIVPLSTWGLPQRRHRLIIIAACPGEILPKMPAPTHSENGEGGLKPFVTVNQTLSKIPRDAPNHDPDQLIFADGRRMRPWSGDKILPRAMTTSGGQNYHPSGIRDFTLREYACLQGFPLHHVFRGTGIKKQIGNAVPPCVATVLFRSIKRDLDEVDGMVEGQEIITID